MVRNTLNHHLLRTYSGIAAASAEGSDQDAITVGILSGSRLERFEILLRRYEPLVHAVCRQAKGAGAAAEALCEQVFVDVYLMEEDLTREPLRFLETVLCRVVGSEVPGSVAPEDISRAVRFWHSLSGLNREDRQILLLRFVAGLGISDLAGMFRLSDEAMRDRLWQVMSRMEGRCVGEN